MAPPAGYAPPRVNVSQYAPTYASYAGVPYGNPYASGGLTGAANAINAQGEFEQHFQQARLMNQDVERSKFDTRPAQIEEWKWERAGKSDPTAPPALRGVRRDRRA
jgi:hypothetical protein